MPRKAFVNDLQQCIANFTHARISGVNAGLEDGSLIFDYSVPPPAGVDVTIQALVTDVGDYPSSHMFMIFTTSENVPAHVSTIIENVGTLDGFPIRKMLCRVTKYLDRAIDGSQRGTIGSDDDDTMMFDGHSPELSEAESLEGSEPESIDLSSPKSPIQSNNHSIARASSTMGNPIPTSVTSLRRTIRSDLRKAKEAGFRIGHLGGLDGKAELCYLTLSVRVAKLRISDEAMQAWHLDPNLYFLLLIRYTGGYRPLGDLLKSNSLHRSEHAQFRMGLTRGYKISMDAAIKAFSTPKQTTTSLRATASLLDEPSRHTDELMPIFIGQSLQDLLNDRLLPIVHYRSGMGFGWNGGEAWYHDHQGSNWTSDDVISNKYYAPDDPSRKATLPEIVTRDHLALGGKNISFPLVAMQFALRHLVRCTEFCLVCHAPMEDKIEALKPYVCSKPLCLYQYMAFGFGPSIEHDIICQPHVVDLLISFCYSSAQGMNLKNLPNGMSLSVPAQSPMPGHLPPIQGETWNGGPLPPIFGGRLPLILGGRLPPIHGSTPHTTGLNGYDGKVSKGPEAFAFPLSQPVRTYKARFDNANMELILEPGEPALHKGQWIMVRMLEKSDERFHCCVTDVLRPTVRLGPRIKFPLKLPLSSTPSRSKTSTVNNVHPSSLFSNSASAFAPLPAQGDSAISSKYSEVDFVIYDQNFDDLSYSDKQVTVCLLLDTLPSVAEMRDYLQSKMGKDRTLKDWHHRISPAAAGILRWIIASNRSCIVEVDRIEGETCCASEERVKGMPQWMQFRFAQGAPDKEQRFIQSIEDISGQNQYPSMYAWHGSPLRNWHSIVREGLHFRSISHGRAYGDGVYHAPDVATSLGYSGGVYSSQGRNAGNSSDCWPQSQLKISQAIALNEIVNAPSQFVSKSPFLVVAQLDWIQTRYLFVKISTDIIFDHDVTPTEICSQDPAYTPVGPNREKIVIPITAVSKSRRPAFKSVPKGDKKSKVAIGSKTDDAIVLSDDTDGEDLNILVSDNDDEEQDHEAQQHSNGGDPPSIEQAPRTDFVAGSLDHKSLQLLDPPPFATPMATKALQRELNSTLKIQDTHPGYELGWYIDRDIITNMYQWIIELHSFEESLPLARDLKAKGLTSVIMEVRFGKDYPMSPPFVRIIRPRFLSFMAGGGGHVTAGGALCMELLTNSGWSAVSNMESVLLQVRLAMSSTDPRPARLEPGPVRDYGVGEAVDAYIRACTAHGWQIPPDFRSNYLSGSSNGNERPLPALPI
ncbi:MAG: hypothetical protein Q9220_003185 [cf. Caloplaca sp. 1 TL-2023]